jgi:hypothetical protein
MGGKIKKMNFTLVMKGEKTTSSWLPTMIQMEKMLSATIVKLNLLK